MKRSFILTALFISTGLFAQTPCVGGMAGIYPCNGYDLISHIPLSTFNTSGANDSWGWTDPINGDEYYIMGLEDGVAFIDISDPINPVYLGKLPTHTSSTVWRDIKVYQDYAFIVSEAGGHGMQVFDLTRLRNVASPPVVFTEDAHYNGVGAAHNLVLNEDTGYAYMVGGDSNGATFIDVSNPLSPQTAGQYTSSYIHDAQVVTYSGPDTAYTGQEIMISCNGWEQTVKIINVTNKSNPQVLATIFYANPSYSHQVWFTEDQRYILIGDEIDEQDFGFNTKTLVYDLNDLNNPVHDFDYFGTTPATDHNGYVVGDSYYLANYAAGLRVLDISDIENNTISESGYFDTYPSGNNAGYDAVWNVYPFFGSGHIAINDRSGGFFLVKASAVDTTPPNAVCQDFTAEISQNGQVIIAGSDIDGGSSDDSGFVSFTVTPNTFDCSNIGNTVTVTLTVTDPSGNTDTCTAQVTVVDTLGPLFDCLADGTVPFDSGQTFYTLPDYVALGDITATDNCTANVTISQDPIAGTQLALGVHTISFEATDDEGNTSTCAFDITVVPELGIIDSPFIKGISIYPNPSKGLLTIASKNENITSLSVVDLTGKKLFDSNSLNLELTTIDISAFAKGIYFVTINEKATKKIIKQ
ncbi:MAG: choice-of-anchor B family protein [Flavobacteriaceae bacterium]